MLVSAPDYPSLWRFGLVTSGIVRASQQYDLHSALPLSYTQLNTRDSSLQEIALATAAAAGEAPLAS